MKYPPETYAKAFLAVIEKTPSNRRDEVIKRFLEVIQKSGDLKRVGKIVETINETLIRKGGGHLIKIEAAREFSKKLIAEISKNFSKQDQIEISINPALVAGTRITIDGERELDNSLTRKLHRLFK